MKSLAGSTQLLLLAGVITLSACSSYPVSPEGAAEVREKLIALQSDPTMSNRAVLPLQQAEAAVVEAEQPTKDKALALYRVKLADKKVEIAKAVAQTSYLDEQYQALGQQQTDARLDSRTQEADAARSDAKLARQDAIAAEAESELARQQALELQQQIAELNAKATERGWVVTLGDVLFDTGRADLKPGALNNLAKLSAFLQRYPDRTVQIEGHTDSVGNSDANQGLSERRANSVRRYLEGQGIAAARLTARGLGENSPIADNESSASRQQNRRVEVIIANAP